MIWEGLGRSVDTAIARFGAIIIGLAIGTAAKYGLLLTDGKRITVRVVVIDLCLLAMLGLIAIAFADAFNLRGNARVMCGALAAVSSDRLIRMVRDRFERSASAHMGHLLPDVREESIVGVPAGNGEPDMIDVQMPPADSARDRMAANLRRGFGTRGTGPVPADQIEQLRRLDRD